MEKQCLKSLNTKDEPKEINTENKINKINQEKNNFIEKITSIAKEDLEKNNHLLCLNSINVNKL